MIFLSSTIKEPKRTPSIITPWPSEVLTICKFYPLAIYNSPSTERIVTVLESRPIDADLILLSHPKTIKSFPILVPHLTSKDSYDPCTFYHIPPGKSPFYSSQLTPFAQNTHSSFPITSKFSSLMANAKGLGDGLGAYIANSFFHCQEVKFKQYRSFTCFAGLSCFPP